MSSNEEAPGAIKRSSLGHEAAAIIRDRIIHGSLSQGEKMREEDFSLSLGISRACIREAFMILESEGLVKRVRNRHTEVMTFHKRDIEDVISLRAAVELLCAETCMDRGTLPLDELKEMASRIQAIIADSGPDVDIDYAKADMALHELVVTASENERAISVWRGLRSQVETLVYSVCRDNPGLVTDVGFKGHDDLVRAFEAGDKQKALEILKEHIESNLPSLLSRAGQE